MVDIHTHILPGIDDGAANWDEAYEMAAMAADSGVDTIVCTHHSNIPGLYYNYNSRELDALFLEFQRGLHKGGFPIKLLRGMEIFSTPDICDKIWNRHLLPINGTNYFLVEFSFHESEEYMADLLRDMLHQGMRPVIAYPERYACMKENPELLFQWMKFGVLSQINKGSLLGKFGRSAERAASIFMKHNLVTCIASDAHNPRVRTTHMGEIKRFLKHKYSEDMAIKLLDDNPRRIVEGKKISNKNILPFRKEQ